jgi:hypothetical protein
MKPQLLLINLLVLGLGSLVAQPALAQTCVKGNTQSTAYMQREGDNRCEGVQPIDAAGSFSLISLTTGRIATLSNLLKLEVPSSHDRAPKVRVRSFQKNYQLDPIALHPNGSRYEFQWSNFVLKNENISPASLRHSLYQLWTA